MSVWQDWSRNERRGNYALLTGVMMTMILGFSAFSVDISLITLAQIQAQAAADAASHAALVAFREDSDTSDGDTAAQWIVNYDKVAMGTATIDAGYPQYGQWNFNTDVFAPGLVDGNANAVRVKLSRTGANAVDLLLAPILGVNTHDVQADSITATQLRAIMLVVDMSCSMMGSVSSFSAVDYNRVGALTFLDYFVDHPQEGDMLGLSMFAQFGNTSPALGTEWGAKIVGQSPSSSERAWMPLSLVATDESLIRQRYMGICNTSAGVISIKYPTTWQCNVGAGPTYLITSLLGTLVNRPRQDTNGTCKYSYCSGTGTGIGSSTNPEPAIRQATNELVDNTDARYFRGILFMSDGVPNPASLAPGALSAADDAWAEDISIWCILYQNGDFDDTFMQNMVRGVGFFMSSPSASDLPAMYEEVAKSIPTALVY